MSRVLIGGALLAAMGALLASSALTSRDPVAPADARIRGASLGLFASDLDYDYGVMVEEIAARGFTDVLVAVEWADLVRVGEALVVARGELGAAVVPGLEVRQLGAQRRRLQGGEA